MKLSKRLEAIANLITDDDRVLDVGCDHGYLDIYLALYKNNKTIIASDISKEVIKTTIENINKYNVSDKIKTYCTNGTLNIPNDYDTIILSGMGSTTILDILSKTKHVKKLIVSSHNNWDIIRKSITLMNYYLSTELLVLERDKLYSIMVFTREKRKLSNKELLIGIYNKDNIDMYQIYYKNTLNIYKKIPLLKIRKKFYYLRILISLKSYIRKRK